MDLQDLIKTRLLEEKQKSKDIIFDIAFEEVQEAQNEQDAKDAQKVKKEAQSKDAAADLLKQLGQFIQPSGGISLDKKEILNLIDSKLKEFKKPKQSNIYINNILSKIFDSEEILHKDFEKVLIIASLKLNVWLTGSAGAGKSTLCAQVASALNLPFYAQSVCEQTTELKLLGYNDAKGDYSSTIFYEAYKNGGVFLLDEVDHANPNVLNVLNGALANKLCAFPCGMVKQHEDFICIAAANTTGSGANTKYIGANRIGAATLDRFVFVNFEIDENLELEISENKEFTKEIQALRAKALAKGLNCIISPRASQAGGKLVNAGFSKTEALNMVIFNKLSEQEVSALKN